MNVDVERLERHVRELARVPRPPETPELERARAYVETCLREARWAVRRHSFRVDAFAGGCQGVNLVATLDDSGGSIDHARSDTAAAAPRFCLGAHLDSREETPGADDNASGVAALLEVARLLPDRLPAQRALALELVVFDLEEIGMLGGAEHARLMRRENADLRGMISLEMIGYADSRPGTQELPVGFAGLYPDTGNFIGVVGNEKSASLVQRTREGLIRVPGLPVESLVIPGNGEILPMTRLSDHSPFWDAGYPALMITDTSFLRNPHYHLPSDTPETLDFDFLARVTQGVLEAMHDFSARGL